MSRATGGNTVTVGLDDMAESDADVYYGVKAVEARQLAWLTGQFYEALELNKVPEPLRHDITLSWFEFELAESELVITDDD